MASRMDKLNQLPTWQLGAAWVVVAFLGVIGWYFLYYADAAEQREQSRASVSKAKSDLDEVRKRLENFELEMQQQKDREKEISAAKEKLPLGSSTVDHLIRTFNQQGRLVGLNIESWEPGGEKKLDFYAKMPVAVKAQGTWNQVGEFFRRVSELDQIVNIEGLKLKTGRNLSETGHPILEVEFEANAFRFLSDEERKAGTGKTDKKKSRRDQKKEG